ncbi:MAG: alpha/beta fold hydrolase [Acidocella sp.]|nr:alpha/beta fold hydrolase [Acidocella sp.]
MSTPSPQRPEQPAPLSRRGPRPLLLHLNLAWMRSSASIAGSPNWNNVWPSSRETNPQPPDPEALAALFVAVSQQDRALIAGIAAYRASPYTRDLADPPAIWEESETRLLDYGGSGPAILFVPSLINRAYIVDLMPEASMLRWLAAHGSHPYLLDWGWPGEIERHFTLTDYIAGRLERALGLIPGPVILAGYCMGGLLALAAAQRHPEKITALALLATPWDFHADNPAQAKSLSQSLAMLEPMMSFSGTLPIDALQTIFTMIDPFGVGEKYRSFATVDKTSPRARRFVAMEDWLADGVPLAAPVARETLGGWYGENTPARLAWRVAGIPVNPASIKIPCFVAAPARDKLVPPVSVRPLATALPFCTYLEPAAGHIGMIAGTNAQNALWQPFADWLQQL